MCKKRQGERKGEKEGDINPGVWKLTEYPKQSFQMQSAGIVIELPPMASLTNSTAQLGDSLPHKPVHFPPQAILNTYKP